MSDETSDDRACPRYDVAQKTLPLRRLSMHIASNGETSVSGPADVVPPQIRPGSACRREWCPSNDAGTCAADPESEPRGSFAPFRPLCPEMTVALAVCVAITHARVPSAEP